MNTRRVAALLIGCCAFAGLPLWRPAWAALHDDTLWFIGPLIGLTGLCVAILVTGGSLALAVGVFTGDPQARLMAIACAAVALIMSVIFVLSGGVGSLMDNHDFMLVWLLAFLGSLVVLVLLVRDGGLPSRPHLFTPPEPRPGVTPWFVGLGPGQWAVAAVAFGCLVAGLAVLGLRRQPGGVLLVALAFILGAAVDLQRHRTRQADGRH